MVDAEFRMDHQRTMHDVADRLRDIQNTMGRNLNEAAEEIALRVLATAARLVNVDTGRLRASLNWNLQELGEWAVKVSVGSPVSYAPYHEIDYPFLRPAVEANEAEIRRLVEEAIEAVVEEAHA